MVASFASVVHSFIKQGIKLLLTLWEYDLKKTRGPVLITEYCGSLFV